MKTDEWMGSYIKPFPETDHNNSTVIPKWIQHYGRSLEGPFVLHPWLYQLRGEHVLSFHWPLNRPRLSQSKTLIHVCFDYLDNLWILKEPVKRGCREGEWGHGDYRYRSAPSALRFLVLSVLMSLQLFSLSNMTWEFWDPLLSKATDTQCSCFASQKSSCLCFLRKSWAPFSFLGVTMATSWGVYLHAANAVQATKPQASAWGGLPHFEGIIFIMMGTHLKIANWISSIKEFMHDQGADED